MSHYVYRVVRTREHTLGRTTWTELATAQRLGCIKRQVEEDNAIARDYDKAEWVMTVERAVIGDWESVE